MNKSALCLFVALGLFSTSCMHTSSSIPVPVDSPRRGPASVLAVTSAPPEGLWTVRGVSSLRGAYAGQLEIRKDAEGKLKAVRIVTYAKARYRNLSLQEVWTGNVLLQGKGFVIQYSLRQADFIDRLGSITREPQDYQQPLFMMSSFELDSLKSEFSETKVGSFAEKISDRQELEAFPLWEEARQKFSAKTQWMPGLPIMAFELALKAAKTSLGYDDDARIKSYSDRADFKDEKPFMVVDTTDFEFYRENNDILRVVNKVVDDISLAEAIVRRDAFVPSLSEKQKGFESNTQEYHVNEAGMVSPAFFDENGQFLRFEPEGDAALWTGMYVASQAMRFKVTEDKQALRNLQRSLTGMLNLIDVTGDPKEFARTLDMYRENEKIREGWKRGAGPLQHLIWLPLGNNDMVKGVLHAAIWAAAVVPKSEKETWDQLRDKTKKILQLRIINEKPQNKAAALGLAAFVHQDAQTKKEYHSAVRSLKAKFRGLFDGGFYYNGSADWSGINLSMVGDLNDILVADLLEEKEIAQKLKEKLTDSWSTYESVRRHFLTVSAYAFAYKEGVEGADFKSRTSKARFLSAVDQSKWALREIPFPRPRFDVSIDYSKRPEWSMSPIPRVFWKSFKDPQPPIKSFYQGLYSYPLFELQAFSSSFLWKDSAFNFELASAQGYEQPGVDYLYTYWMGRMAGLFDQDAE